MSDKSDYSGFDLKFIVLKMLSITPMHGYKLASEIELFFGKKPSNGALAPLFDFMEREELVVSTDTVESGKYKKIYSLTDKGRDYLNNSVEKMKSLLNYWLIIFKYLKLILALIWIS